MWIEAYITEYTKAGSTVASTSLSCSPPPPKKKNASNTVRAREEDTGNSGSLC